MPDQMPEPPQPVADVLNAGREALVSGQWEKARESYRMALAQGETPEALEGLAEAAWWLHDEEATMHSREQAYRLYRQRGDSRAAARMATWLATDSVEFRGQAAVANGWVQRARHLLSGLESSPEYGWLAVSEGHLALNLRNDTTGAIRLCEEAMAIGHRHDLLDLEMLGQAIAGYAMVSEGRVSEGVNRLDEAAITALSGEMHDLNAMFTVLCYMVSACDRVRDYDRAAQWCLRTKEFMESKGLAEIFSVCRPQYAAVLQWRGEWAEAESELLKGTGELAALRPAMATEGLVRLAELRWRQGHVQEARDLFHKTEHDPLSLPGRAEMAMDEGDVAVAANLVEQFLRRLPREGQLERFHGLELMVRIAVKSGEIEKATAALAELSSIAADVETGPLQASVTFAQGLVAAATGKPEEARHRFEDAIELFHRNGAHFETAQVYIELARVLHVLGDVDAALREARSAHLLLVRLGAVPEAGRAASLLQEMAARGASVTPPNPAGLTQREVEVLQLIAAGKSNTEIAVQLTLSLRTVERHISNIYGKLGATGKVARAVATAFALNHGLG